MSQIRLYVDEDAAERAVVEGLRARGIDVLTVFDVGRDSDEDGDQLAFAAGEGRCIYSLNVGDFCRLHQQFLAQGQEHAGIILVPRQRYSAGEKIRRLVALVNSTSSEEMRNRLEFL
jgi:hypothetical protein